MLETSLVHALWIRGRPLFLTAQSPRLADRGMSVTGSSIVGHSYIYCSHGPSLTLSDDSHGGQAVVSISLHSAWRLTALVSRLPSRRLHCELLEMKAMMEVQLFSLNRQRRQAVPRPGSFPFQDHMMEGLGSISLPPFHHSTGFVWNMQSTKTCCIHARSGRRS